MNKLQPSHSFQKNLSLDDCVDKLREAGTNKPRRIKGVDFPRYKLHIEQHIDESYGFQLTLGGEIKLYSSTFIQVQAAGQLSRVDDENTSVSYFSKVLWTTPIFLYGITVIFIVWIFLSSEIFAAMIGILVIVANVGWEAHNARNYLEEIPILIESILTS